MKARNLQFNREGKERLCKELANGIFYGFRRILMKEVVMSEMFVLCYSSERMTDLSHV